MSVREGEYSGLEKREKMQEGRHGGGGGVRNEETKKNEFGTKKWLRSSFTVTAKHKEEDEEITWYHNGER